MRSQSRLCLFASSLLIGLLFSFGFADAVTPAIQWNKRFGNTSSDAGRAVAVDAAGNVFVAGKYQVSVDFGGGTLTSAGGDEAFIAKFDANGNHLWSRSYGQVGSEVTTDIAVDASGNVYMTGYFNSSMNFTGSTLSAVGGIDMFLAKLNPAGTALWAFRYGSGSDDIAYGLTLDASANVIITGTYRGQINFGGSIFNTNGFEDIFIAKFNTNGAHLASTVFGSTGADFGNDVGTDAAGNVYLTGYFNNTVNFGGGGLVSAGAQDIVLAKYDPNLVHVWSKRFGSTGADLGNALGVNSTGEVQITGSFNNTVDFGGGGLVSGGGSDVFLARYASNGAHLWSKNFAGAGNATGFSLSVDATGRIFVAGSFASSMDMGGGPLSSAGADDIFVGQFNSSGTHLWSARFGSTGTDVANGVGTDGAGRLAMTGSFNTSLTVPVDFGAGPLSSAGSDDIFVAKFTDRNPTPLITAITDIGNDQGRKVKVRFNGSGYDYSPTTTVTSYEVYRKDAAPPSSAASMPTNPAGLSTHALLVGGWTLAGTTPAHGDLTYGVDVPTIGDSTLALGQYYSVFYVRAATASPIVYYESTADSGYSVDNLAPSVPQNFVFNAGNLTWHDPVDADFKFFTVYGSNTNSFGTATLVNYTTGTNMNVSPSPYVYYYVTATDFSGNEGKPAKVNSLSGVGGTPQSYVLSVSNYPNPFNPRTTVNYTVPQRGTVSVAVYDVHGAFVTTLFHGERTAGAYQAQWDGRAEDGAVVGSGIYFARIEQNGAARTKKMVLLK